MPNYIDSLGNTMTCETQPNFDSWSPFDDYWLCVDWVTYHKKLVNDCGYSNDEALNIVQQKLQDRRLFGNEFFCQFDSEFREYFEDKGADFGFFSSIFYNTGKGVESVSSGFAKAGSILNLAIPVAFVGVGIYFAVKAYKKLK